MGVHLRIAPLALLLVCLGAGCAFRGYGVEGSTVLQWDKVLPSEAMPTAGVGVRGLVRNSFMVVGGYVGNDTSLGVAYVELPFGLAFSTMAGLVHKGISIDVSPILGLAFGDALDGGRFLSGARVGASWFPKKMTALRLTYGWISIHDVSGNRDIDGREVALAWTYGW